MAPGANEVRRGVFGGITQTSTIDTVSGDFRTLVIQIRETDLMDRHPGNYVIAIALNIALFAAGWAALVIERNSWAVLGVAAFLGVMFMRLAFMSHDAGHQQVFRSRRANWRLGLIVGNALIGLSFGWWVSKHSAHHAHPNQTDRDPDVGVGLVTRSSKESALEGWLARWQAWLFFPLMLLRSAGLHISGIQNLVRQGDRAAAREGLLIAIHAALYLTAVIWILTPLRALVFVVVHQAVFSLYLGCSFAPNHKGMPILESTTEMSFVRRQVMTARNVSGGRCTNFLLGGLNYQIEHHLFPTMPRSNLARAQPIVRAFCIENGLGYVEEGVSRSFRSILRHLSALGGARRSRPLGTVGIA